MWASNSDTKVDTRVLLLLLCSSSVSIVYVVCLHIVLSKAALQKRGSMEPMEPPLDPPLSIMMSRMYGSMFGSVHHYLW